MSSNHGKGNNRAYTCLRRCFVLQMQSVLLAVVFVVLTVTLLFEFCIVTTDSFSQNCPDSLMQVKISHNPGSLEGTGENMELLRQQGPSLNMDGRVALNVDGGSEIGERAEPDDGLRLLARDLRVNNKRKPTAEQLKALLVERRTSLTNKNDISNSVTEVEEEVVEQHSDYRGNEIDNFGKTDNKWNHGNTLNQVDSNRDEVKVDLPTFNESHKEELKMQSDVFGATADKKNTSQQQLDTQPKDGNTRLMINQEKHITEIVDQLLHFVENQETQLEPKKSVAKDKKEKVSKNSKTSKKKKSSKRNFTLPDNYPLFASPYPPPTVDGHTCRDGLCSEYLQTEDDLFFYKNCLARQITISDYAKSKPGPCHFMNGSRRAPVALASFPGSGNTWVRGLLEKATGICTGAIYCDKSIRVEGMNGEAVRSGAVIAVKTHKAEKVSWTDPDKPQPLISGKLPAYSAAILIVRNPHRALIAEWNRANSKLLLSATPGVNRHVTVIGQEHFGNNSGWKLFIETKLPKWPEYFVQWVVDGRKHNRPVLVVRYEDLKLDTFKEVKRMLDFLHFEYKDKELKQRLSTDFKTFHRKHGDEDFEHFLSDQRKLVDKAITSSIDNLKANNDGETFGLEDYLGTIV